MLLKITLRMFCPNIFTLKNKGALRNVLSKWFHKEPLTSEEPFCFTNGSLWYQNCSSLASLEEHFEAPLFLRVYFFFFLYQCKLRECSLLAGMYPSVKCMTFRTLFSHPKSKSNDC